MIQYTYISSYKCYVRIFVQVRISIMYYKRLYVYMYMYVFMLVCMYVCMCIYRGISIAAALHDCATLEMGLSFIHNETHESENPCSIAFKQKSPT